LLVRAIDPLTHGALRARLQVVGGSGSLNLRSFLDRPIPDGHTIKGSGKVSFRDNRKNSTFVRLPFNLIRALDRHLQSKGVKPSDYNYGKAMVLDKKAIVSINGRRYVPL
jgi:hypothetical protein